jgi:hypothetical protein
MLAAPSADNVGDVLVGLSNEPGPYQGRATDLLAKLTGKQVDPKEAADQIAAWFTAEAKKDHVTFEQAAVKARVPTDVEWRFVTEAGFGGYGDNQYSGYVVYGRSPSNHVFVAVRFVREVNYFTGRDVDYYTMSVHRYPLSQPLKTLAPKVIRELWASLGKIKGYNAKVYLLPENAEFTAVKYRWQKGRPIAFKDALVQLGELSADDPMVKNRKLTVELHLRGRIAGQRGEYHDLYRMMFVINGKEYPLSDAGCRALQADDSKFLNPIFGTYVYPDSKKNVTRSRNAKAVLEYAARVLTSEPQDLRDLLQQAASQVKS